MKKFTFLKRWTSLATFIFCMQTISAQENPKEYSLGTATQFLNSLQAQTANKRIDNQRSNLILNISENESLNALINFEKIEQGKNLHIEGEITGKEKGTFSIIIEDDKVKGNIILLEAKKAYAYKSDNNKNAFITQIDINKTICTDFPIPDNIQTSHKKNTPDSNIDLTNLQSLPNAAGCLLLDFDGFYLPAGSGWNGGNPIDAQPSGMTDSDILEAWEIVAEDFRPFNLNVTTNEDVFNSYPQNKRRRCVITPTNKVSPNNGGYALINNFSSFSDLPCWAFSSPSGSSGKIMGEIASHELGHTLGLSHDGQSQYAYYSGHGNWAPIMGQSYYQPVTQWSKAEYINGTNHEDDLAIISGANNAVGYRADTHGNTFSAATPLVVSGEDVVSKENHGVIVQTGDIDIFRFASAGGAVKLNIQAKERHSNLLLQVSLYDGRNQLIETYNANPQNLGETITIDKTLPAGNYYLAVTGNGFQTPDTGFTNYASLGFYNISGIISNKSNSKLSTTNFISKDEIKIYPNPVKDYLIINSNSSDKHEIEIYNNSGQLTENTITKDGISKISFSDKLNGIYILNIKNIKTGLQKSFKIIKE